MSDFLIVFIILLSFGLFFFSLPYILKFAYWLGEKYNNFIDKRNLNKKED